MSFRKLVRAARLADEAKRVVKPVEMACLYCDQNTKTAHKSLKDCSIAIQRRQAKVEGEINRYYQNLTTKSELQSALSIAKHMWASYHFPGETAPLLTREQMNKGKVEADARLAEVLFPPHQREADRG